MKKNLQPINFSGVPSSLFQTKPRMILVRSSVTSNCLMITSAMGLTTCFSSPNFPCFLWCQDIQHLQNSCSISNGTPAGTNPKRGQVQLIKKLEPTQFRFLSVRPSSHYHRVGSVTLKLIIQNYQSTHET